MSSPEKLQLSSIHTATDTPLAHWPLFLKICTVVNNSHPIQCKNSPFLSVIFGPYFAVTFWTLFTSQS